MAASVVTCLDCKVLPPFSIELCALHAAAERMRTALEIIATIDGQLDVDDVNTGHNASVREIARAALPA